MGKKRMIETVEIGEIVAPAPTEIGRIKAQRTLVRELLRQGKYFDSIFIRHPDIRETKATEIMSDEFLNVLLKDDPTVIKRWEIWKEKQGLE